MAKALYLCISFQMYFRREAQVQGFFVTGSDNGRQSGWL